MSYSFNFSLFPQQVSSLLLSEYHLLKFFTKRNFKKIGVLTV